MLIFGTNFTSINLQYCFYFRGGFEIDFRNPRYLVSEDGKELTILLSEIDDTGSYRCIAENPAGETEKSFELDVQGEKNEPRHEKTCLCHKRTAKAQISLRIRAV